MAHMNFTGPEGARWAGKSLLLVSDKTAKVRDLAAMQMATGWTLSDFRKMVDTDRLEGVAIWSVAFLTLRSAGYMVTWEKAGEICLADFEVVADPLDGQDLGEDPTEPAGSHDLAGEKPAAAPTRTSPRSPSSRGSSSRSAAGSSRSRRSGT